MLELWMYYRFFKELKKMALRFKNYEQFQKWIQENNVKVVGEQSQLPVSQSPAKKVTQSQATGIDIGTVCVIFILLFILGFIFKALL